MGFWRDRQVLVTGGGGFIGSHLVEALYGEGARVRVLIRYHSGGRRGFLDDLAREVQAAIDVHAATVEDPFVVRRAVDGCDTVFHLAALIGIPYSYVAPHHYVQTNVVGTVNVLQACLDAGVRRLVHTSTSETYGTAQYTPIDERHPLVGQSPYAATKIGADQLALSYFRSFGLPVTVARPFNTYGPRQSARAVIPALLAQVAAGVSPVRLGSLSPRRDLNEVSDTVRAFLGLGACDGAVGEVVHFGTGQTWSVGEVVEAAGRALGRSIDVVSSDDRIRPQASEVELLCADASKAARLFGFRPQVGLEEGLQRVFHYICAHPDRYRAADYTI